MYIKLDRNESSLLIGYGNDLMTPWKYVMKLPIDEILYISENPNKDDAKWISVGTKRGGINGFFSELDQKARFVEALKLLTNAKDTFTMKTLLKIKQLSEAKHLLAQIAVRK